MTATSNRRASAAPTQKVLVALTIVVLAGHWLALGGRIPLWPGQWFKSRSSLDLLPDPQATDPKAAALSVPSPEPSAAVAPVSTSTVRWIAPPAPPPPPPPPKPKPVVRKAPPPPPPPTLSSAIEELGAPSIEPLTADEMMQDIVANTEPEPPLQPAPEVPLQNDVPVAIPPATAITDAVPSAPEATVATGPAVAMGSLPANASLSYAVKGLAKGFNYSAGGTLTWQQTGNTYEAQLDISAFLLGSFQRTSTGLITPQGLAPQRFVDRRRSKEKTAVFDRGAGLIRYSAKTPDVAIQPGAQDQLSVMLQLAGLLNTREQLVEGNVISVPVSSGTDAEIWRFEIGALENLRLPVGEVPARRLIRQARKPNDKTVEVWLSPSLGRLPVRMRLTEPNGDFMDQVLDDLPDGMAQPVSPTVAPNNSVP